METHHWKMLEGTLSVSPKKFNATMKLQVQATDTEKIEELSDKKELWNYPVPDLGFEIKHLCTVGVVLQYQIGYSTKVLGSDTFVFGATSSLPDDAVFNIDLKDHDRSFQRGFKRYALHPIFDIKAISDSVKFAVYTQADVVIGIELEKIGKVGVELNLKIPQLSTTVNAGYSKHFSSPALKSELITNLCVLIEEGGFCSHEDGAVSTGAKMTTALSLELWFEAYAGKDKHGFYSRKLFNVTDTLDEECQPLDIKKFVENPLEMAQSILLPLSAIPSIAP